MLILDVQFAQFRNLRTATLPVGKKQVLFVGENGQGKTNFLEALYLLCYGNSFRTQNIREIPTAGTSDFKLSASFLDEEQKVHQLGFLYKNGKKYCKIDGKNVIDRKELIYTIPCIVFSHEDISFVNGEPEYRRKFFNQTMSMYDELFFDDLRHYNLILRQRNQAIKDKQYSLLGVYDTQLASYGLHIQNARTKAVYEFNQIFPSLYKKVSGTDWDVSVSYRPSWGNCATEDDICNVLLNTRDRDYILQTTSSGIHRDRFVVTSGDELFASRGSTGQVRLASLLFRLAQMRFFHEKTGRNPIILVDDVFLELDYEKRAKFLDTIDGYDQAFFTFLPEEKYFRSLSNKEMLVYDVSRGEFANHAETV